MDESDEEETPHAEWRWHNDWMLEWVADDATLAMQDDDTICVGIDKGNDCVMVPLVCIDALLVRRGLTPLSARNVGTCEGCKHWWSRRNLCSHPKMTPNNAPGRPWGEPYAIRPPWCPGFEPRDQPTDLLSLATSDAGMVPAQREYNDRMRRARSVAPASAPEPAPIGCCVCGATMFVGEKLTKTARGIAHADHFQNPEPVR